MENEDDRHGESARNLHAFVSPELEPFPSARDSGSQHERPADIPLHTVPAVDTEKYWDPDVDTVPCEHFVVVHRGGRCIIMPRGPGVSTCTCGPPCASCGRPGLTPADRGVDNANRSASEPTDHERQNARIRNDDPEPLIIESEDEAENRDAGQRIPVFRSPEARSRAYENDRNQRDNIRARSPRPYARSRTNDDDRHRNDRTRNENHRRTDHHRHTTERERRSSWQYDFYEPRAFIFPPSPFHGRYGQSQADRAAAETRHRSVNDFPEDVHASRDGGTRNGRATRNRPTARDSRRVAELAARFNDAAKMMDDIGKEMFDLAL